MKRLLLWIAIFAPLSSSAQKLLAPQKISSTEQVNVEVAVGNAPILPYQLWVEYSNGKKEFRQVRWMNSALTTEERQADADRTPVGTTYSVKGYIIGDNTTANGYPVEAQIKVTEKQPSQPSPKAEPLPLNKVCIIGDNRLTHNRDMDIDQLLSLDVTQQLYNYRDTYGLSTEGYTTSDGWDSPTTKLKGHGSGHYMSAMAMAYACCNDPLKKQQLHENIKRMVDELRQCQERTFVWDNKLGRFWEARDLAPEEELKHLQGSWTDFDRYKQDWQHYGYGYLNAIPAQHCALVEKYCPYNNDQGVWAPYYSVHKQLAGLIDIATYVDDKEVAAKALMIAKDMGLWVWNRLHYRTFVKSNGSQEERRSRLGNRHEMWNMYIAGEVGGMAESLSRLSEMVKEPAEKSRLLEAANYFDSPAFFGPLSKNIDVIRTRHANQHIPMITGALRSYRNNHNPFYYHLAQNFWTMIQGRYRYAMGGVGNGEMFRQPYSQMMSLCTNVTNDARYGVLPEPTMNETCCAYNLAKLTKELNCFNPDDAHYLDYYERVLYNQIVGSLNPSKYQTVYQYAVGIDASKPWGNETPQATCCGGTGVENHVKYQEAAYFVSKNTLWVGLYLPTTAVWDAKNITIQQECLWPAEHSVIRIVKGKAKFAMKLRVPYWATEEFDIKLNGKSLQKEYMPCSYVEIPLRKWTKKDKVEIIMPYSRHLDYCPDKMVVAPKDGKMSTFEPMWTATVMNGPLALAAKNIHNWDEATVDITKFDEISFIPDYEADQHVTHYFRLKDTKKQTESVAGDKDNSTYELKEAILVAEERIRAQEEWMSQTEKVTPDAPWAKYGYERMKNLYNEAKALLNRDNGNSQQDEIKKAATELNMIINTMRPGNLPELEDLQELTSLLEKVKMAANSQSDALRGAIRYAEMVVRYVNDGSGTRDMIKRAVGQLKTY